MPCSKITVYTYEEIWTYKTGESMVPLFEKRDADCYALNRWAVYWRRPGSLSPKMRGVQRQALVQWCIAIIRVATLGCSTSTGVAIGRYILANWEGARVTVDDVGVLSLLSLCPQVVRPAFSSFLRQSRDLQVVQFEAWSCPGAHSGLGRTGGAAVEKTRSYNREVGLLTKYKSNKILYNIIKKSLL